MNEKYAKEVLPKLAEALLVDRIGSVEEAIALIAERTKGAAELIALIDESKHPHYPDGTIIQDRRIRLTLLENDPLWKIKEEIPNRIRSLLGWLHKIQSILEDDKKNLIVLSDNSNEFQYTPALESRIRRVLHQIQYALTERQMVEKGLQELGLLSPASGVDVRVLDPKKLPPNQ